MFARSRSGNSILSKKRSRSRTGVAAVEFAVCLPMLLAICFGSIELTNAIFVKRSLVSAAYEAGNVASSIGGTSTVAVQRGNGVLTLLGVKSGTVSVTPTVTTNTATGTPITVTCTATLANNTVTGWCLGNMTFTAKCTVLHL